MAKLERLDGLLQRDPERAKIEILKHLDGDRRAHPARRRRRMSAAQVWWH
jgi:hypothetical protein